MTIDINLENFVSQFQLNEQEAILAEFIEASFRYDFERIARKFDMRGRSVLAPKYRNYDSLPKYLILPFHLFDPTNSTPQDILARLEKKAGIIRQALQDHAFEQWLAEFIKVYSLHWVLHYITKVLKLSRSLVTEENINYNMTISLESVSYG